MNYIFRVSLLLISALCFSACKSAESKSESSQQQPQTIPQQELSTGQDQQNNIQPTPASPNSTETKNEEKYFADIFTKSDRLSYKGYKVVALEKEIIDKDYKDTPIDVTYAVVKKGGKVLGKFDGVYFGLGNATEFGLFNFLGSKTKELAISQTVPRGGRHWIVRLHPYYKVIFDSANYEVGREEVQITDLDHDGIYEIGLAVTSFYLVFREFSMAETPLPWVIFKYDKKTARYLPANHLFRDYLLEAIDERINNLSEDPKSTGFVSSRVDILVDYLYAGKEKEGWAFFNKVYNLPDKETVKATVRKVLKKGRAFQFIKNTQGRNSFVG